MSLIDAEERLAAGLDRLGEVALLGVRSVSRSRSVMPMTPLIGVRISWLIVARKSDFIREPAIAASRAAASSCPPARTR